MMEDDIIVRTDLKRRHISEFLHQLKQVFDVEKKFREDNMQRELKLTGTKMTCACGNCKFPVWFTYHEIVEILEDLYKQNKERKLNV